MYAVCQWACNWDGLMLPQLLTSTADRMGEAGFTPFSAAEFIGDLELITLSVQCTPQGFCVNKMEKRKTMYLVHCPELLAQKLKWGDR